MLTREFLVKADCKTSFGDIEESLLWSVEQRAASLTATLASRPDRRPLWIFGYGSLMWNPLFEADEVAEATLQGWHRAFCLHLTAGRGSASHPGRMLALKEGGTTRGVAFCLPEAHVHEELTLLWKREMITGCYLPKWCQLTLDDGRTVDALAFVTDPRHPSYKTDACVETVAPLIAAASGPLGSNAQYLFSLEQELNRRGVAEESLCQLAHQVRRLQSETSRIAAQAVLPAANALRGNSLASGSQ